MEMNVDSTHRQRRARSSRRLSHHSFALERMDLQTRGEGTKSHPSWLLVCSNHNDSLTTQTQRKPKWLRMARLRTRLRVDA